MNFDDLKQLIINSGERLILVENGKPCCVVLSFADYRKLANQENSSACSCCEEKVIAKPAVNQGIQLPASDNYITELAKPTAAEDTAAKEMRLEDLPF
jgi:hypothetical protein